MKNVLLRDGLLFYKEIQVIPRPEFVFRSLYLDISKVKVVLMGQDPYPDIEQADGLSFSCNAPKGSVKNMFS